MKKFLLPTIGLLASFLTAQAQTPWFTAGNLAVLRIGGTAGGPSNNPSSSGLGCSVWIDQYTTNGTLVNSYLVPNSGGNALTTVAGAYEGGLSRSPDGKHLVFAGYNAAAPTTNWPAVTAANELSESLASNVSRVVGTLDGYANFAMPITNNAVFNTYPCDAAATDGTNYWMAGAGSSSSTPWGICYVGTATQGATNQVSTNLFNSTGIHNVQIYNGMLFGIGYGSNTIIPAINQAGGFLFTNALGNLPQTLGSFSNYFSDTTANDPQDLVINPANTIAYLADYAAGIIKYTNSPNGWVSNYTIALTNQGYASASGSHYPLSVTADFTQNPVVLYATTDETFTNRLVRLVDSGSAAGANATVINLAANSIVSGAGGYTNTFRGVRFVPDAYPVISGQPVNVTNEAGESISFSVSVIGTPTFTYQWYSNGLSNPTFVAVPSGTNATLAVTNLSAAQSNSMFYVAVANAYGTAESSTATLTVLPPGAPTNVVITPGSQTVDAGAVATLDASFIGAVTGVGYGWTFNGMTLTDGSLGGSTISGSSTLTLTISGALATNDGTYMVWITNSFGVGSNTAVVNVLDPYISTGAIGATNLPGSGNATLSVTAVGTGLGYQWYSNGVALAGATASTYSAVGSSATSSASYTVVVSNSLGALVTNGPTVVSYTPLVFDETFTYPNGNLFKVPGTQWTEISGTSPIYATNDTGYMSQSNAVPGTAFGYAPYSQPVTGSTVIWSSFIINVKSLPTSSTGSYFLDYADTNFDFYGKLYILTANSASQTPDLLPSAYPGLYRIGISCYKSNSGPDRVVELDMAPGIDYHCVAYFDLGNGFAGLSVNPDSGDYSSIYPAKTPSSLVSGYTTDPSETNSTVVLAGMNLREASGEGVFDLDNLETSFDWNGGGSGFAAVTADTVTNQPVIGFITPLVTNFLGNSNILEVAASGIDVSYQWYQGGQALTDGYDLYGSQTPVLTLFDEQATNAGSYTVVVSNVAGAVTSSVAVVNLDTTPTAPIFTLQPVTTVSSLGQNVTFTASAVGTGPLTYQWNTGGSPNGSSGTSFTLTRVGTNLTGTYYSVTVTGGAGSPVTSSNAYLTVNGPVVTNIAYLRSLASFSAAPTITIPASNSATVFQVNGYVIEYTNIESATYAEYWIEDNTGGIEFFVTDPTFRPNYGDYITASGVVDIFDDGIELDGSANNAAEPYYVLNTNDESGNLPFAPLALPWGLPTANPALSAQYYQGSLCTITNAYFTTPGAAFVSGGTVEITNQSGQIYNLYAGNGSAINLYGSNMPAFAYSITAPYDQFDSTFELELSDGALNIVTAPPPPVTNLTATASSGNINIAWTAVPTAYTYSVWSATNLLGPWSSVAQGLWFTNASGTFSGAISPSTPALYFRIQSP